ncbi:MAG: hypothetical protein HQM10_16665 [Candidatus Riflebacteria bacterium]|nr:hypothetical protein [Candidatus Riflebacteria bacterium]
MKKNIILFSAIVALVSGCTLFAANPFQAEKVVIKSQRTALNNSEAQHSAKVSSDYASLKAKLNTIKHSPYTSSDLYDKCESLQRKIDASYKQCLDDKYLAGKWKNDAYRANTQIYQLQSEFQEAKSVGLAYNSLEQALRKLSKKAAPRGYTKQELASHYSALNNAYRSFSVSRNKNGWNKSVSPIRSFLDRCVGI